MRLPHEGLPYQGPPPKGQWIAWICLILGLVGWLWALLEATK